MNFSSSFLSAGCVLFAGLLAPAAAAQGSAAPARALEITPELIDQLTAEAQSRNPALQAAEVRVRAAVAAVAAVRRWPDPTASLGVWARGSTAMTAADEGNIVYGVEEKLPLYRRPELARRLAAADEAKERLAAEAETRKVRREIAEALTDLALVSREAAIARDSLSWVDLTLAAADHRYRVGQGSQVDWLKIQIARAAASEDLITQEQDREHAAFMLNRLLGRELHAAWPPAVLPPAQPGRLYYTPRLAAAAVAANPERRVLQQEIVTAQAHADLTRKEQLPEVSVGLQAWQYSGDGGLRQAMATVSFSLPWLNKSRHEADWRRDHERRRASELAAEDYALSVREELHHHLADLNAAQRQAVLDQDQLLPLTRQTLASAEAAWEHNLGPFQDVLDAHRMLLTEEMTLARALAEQSRMLADLAYLTGTRDPAELTALGGDAAAAHSESLAPSTP